MGALEDALAQFVDARIGQAVTPLGGDVTALTEAAANLIAEAASLTTRVYVSEGAVFALAARVAALEGEPPPDPEPEPDPDPDPVPVESPIKFWVGADVLNTQTPGQLDVWKDRGVGGYVAATRNLPGLGETAAVKAMRTQLESSLVVQRGEVDYLGCWLVNWADLSIKAPLRNWFDDAGWESVALPALRDYAAFAKRLGCKGLAFDAELYKASQTHAANWGVVVAGKSEAEVRAKARQRGGQVMAALLEGFPGLELVNYEFRFPGSFEEKARTESAARLIPAGPAFNAAGQLFGDFWPGALSVPGYSKVEFWDMWFYKERMRAGWNDWDGAITEATRLFHLFMDPKVPDPSKVGYAPFTWIDAGAQPFEAARAPEHVRNQLLAARDHGDGTVPNYCQGFGTFDYGPYLPALKEVS